MTERDFGRALLHGEHPINVDELTQRVLRRDRRRMWILGTFCVVAWMLVVMLPWATILPMLAKIAETATADAGVYADPTTMPAAIGGTNGEIMHPSPKLIELLIIVRQGTIATFIGSLTSMFMAAVCTVALIILSRRATLRQVNARLGEISDQLRAMAK